MNPQELIIAIKQMVEKMDQTMEPKVTSLSIHPNENSATIYATINGSKLIIDVLRDQTKEE